MKYPFLTEIKTILDNMKSNGVRYWDVRLEKTRNESYSALDSIPSATSATDMGVGIRLLYGNPQTGQEGWGFTSTNLLDTKSLEAACQDALATGLASSLLPRVAPEFVPSTETGEWHAPVQKNPFEMSTQEKQQYILDLEATIKGESLVSSHCNMFFREVERSFINSVGADLFQHLIYTGCSMSATVSGEGRIQTRGYPNTFGNVRMGGFEVIESYNLYEHTARIVAEAQEILMAPVCPSENATVVIGPQMMSLIIHEVCGHASEFDRILGEEAAYAGTSFLRPENIGNFKYGSDIVNIVSDPTYAGSVGSYGWDDDGTPAHLQKMVDGGVTVGFLTGRLNAGLVNMESAAANRACGYMFTPINRMTSINFLPGDVVTKEEIIASIDHGYYIDDFCGWSINSDRNGFRFSVENFQKIEKGKLTTKYREGAFSTRTTADFFGNCFAVASDTPYVAGYANCAKGQPMQIITTGHVVPQLVGFHQVKVGK